MAKSKSKSKSKKGRGVPVVAKKTIKGYNAWYRKTKYWAKSVDELCKKLPDACQDKWVKAACAKARKAGK